MAKDDDVSTPSKDELAKDYYLGSSDAPGNLITPIKLRGAKNYDEWSTSVRRALISKRKFGFIDGKIKEPTTDPDKLADWIAIHSMLVSWIKNTVEESLRSTVGDFDDASVLWLHLKKRFCVVSGTRVCQLKSTLGACKQGGNESIDEYYGRLSIILNDLVNYARVPKCVCGCCKCGISTQVAEIREEDHLHHFLIGLDKPYEAIRAQLLAQTPLPTVDEAYQSVINTENLRVEEEQRHGGGIMAFKTEIRSNSNYRDNNDRFCTHCNKSGHETETCYQLVGFPEWWDDRRKGGRSAGRGNGRGGRGGRGRAGSSGSSTPSSTSATGGVRANRVVSKTSQHQASPVTANNIAEGLAGVSPTQVQQIIDLLTSKAKPRLQGPIDEEDDWPGGT
ncbi:uncharacterized protein [Spinacia oleracea]|uniref:Retrotransposon Copia-like N-terminal domain-containing protein n=1 Tax=Spinacia oleracea TaxID=3562 RepID=A0ABM3REF9_SPIOL|nr:uncharacterized protein LOC130468952 [Spinacia oleracea]